MRDFACSRRSKISDRDALFLQLFVDLLTSESQRKIEPETDAHAVTFTDACYERESRDLPCGVGAVFIDPVSGTKQFFSCKLDDKQRSLLDEQSKKQIIFEAETLRPVVGHLVWMKEVEMKKHFSYVDMRVPNSV